MKKYFFVLALSITTFWWTGCESEEPDFSSGNIEVANSNITLDHSNAYELSFNSTFEWTVSLSDTSKTGWCNVFPLTGKGGDAKITVNALPNMNNDRSVTLTLKSGNVEKTVEILQNFGCGVDDIYIPDATFRNYCLEFYDVDGDGHISAGEVERVVKLQMDSYQWRDIKDYQGIEYFKALRDLYISSGYYLTNLDVSKNKNLEKLVMQYSGIDKLDLTNNTKLKHLEGRFSFKELDLSKNTQLEYLSCGSGNLTSIDISNSPNLKYFYCEYNSIKKLDLSKNPALETINIRGGSLEEFVLGNQPNLASLICGYSNLSTLDVSACPNLKNLNCYDNNLSSLDLSGCPYLEVLSCHSNKLTFLNLSGCPNLAEIDCNDNYLTSIDVSKCTKLTQLDCSYNPLTSVLDLTRNLLIQSVYCYNWYGDNKLSEIWLDVGMSTKNVYISKNSETQVVYKYIVTVPH
ncbi:MAG TPA: hypothetical protein DIT04_10910 [Dysgonomonas sp.]|nr:hypothetical protein [Dysgonomonas sp.]